MWKFAYVIGFRYENGDIGDYAIHNHTVFNGTIEDAKNTLDYVKRTCEDKKEREKYQIFKLV